MKMINRYAIGRGVKCCALRTTAFENEFSVNGCNFKEIYREGGKGKREEGRD